MESLYEVSRYINLYQSQPRTYGTEDVLYMAETHLIQIIGKIGKTTITELAKKTHKTKSAISQTVDKLNAKDIVAKGKNPDDN
jgi:DNA-binding MarR family transcriptional regulator